MTVRAYKLGALGQDELTGIKCLAATTAGAGPNYMTFEYPVGTDYQVTSGTTFYITKLDVSAVQGEDARVTIGYGDNGVADGTTTPTNLVLLTAFYSVRTTSPTLEFNVIIPIPQQKYPCIKQTLGTALAVTVYGIQV